jgi:hypothetical protein
MISKAVKLDKIIQTVSAYKENIQELCPKFPNVKSLGD